MTDEPDAHDAELRRIDAQARVRRADAMWAETNASMDGHDHPLRDRLDDLAVTVAERARG